MYLRYKRASANSNSVFPVVAVSQKKTKKKRQRCNVCYENTHTHTKKERTHTHYTRTEILPKKGTSCKCYDARHYGRNIYRSSLLKSAISQRQWRHRPARHGARIRGLPSSLSGYLLSFSAVPPFSAPRVLSPCVLLPVRINFRFLRGGLPVLLWNRNDGTSTGRWRHPTAESLLCVRRCPSRHGKK